MNKLDKKNGFVELLKEIKKDIDKEDNYTPKNYSFGLNNFDENGNFIESCNSKKN